MFHYHYRFIQSVSWPPPTCANLDCRSTRTGSLAACWWSRVWAAVGTVASRVTAGCWNCVILWWFVWCIDTITVNKDFLIIIWLGTFRFINVCIREIPCFKWNYNVNLDVVHESGTKTQICYFPCNSSKTFMFSIFIRLNETWSFQKYFEFFIFMKKVDPSSKKLLNKSFARV